MGPKILKMWSKQGVVCFAGKNKKKVIFSEIASRLHDSLIFEGPRPSKILEISKKWTQNGNSMEKRDFLKKLTILALKLTFF